MRISGSTASSIDSVNESVKGPYGHAQALVWHGICNLGGRGMHIRPLYSRSDPSEPVIYSILPNKCGKNIERGSKRALKNIRGYILDVPLISFFMVRVYGVPTANGMSPRPMASSIDPGDENAKTTGAGSNDKPHPDLENIAFPWKRVSFGYDCPAQI